MLKGDESGAQSEVRPGLGYRPRFVGVLSTTLIGGLWIGGYDWLRPERHRSLVTGLVVGFVMGVYVAVPRLGLLDRLVSTEADFESARTWRWPGVGARLVYELVVVAAGASILITWLVKGERPNLVSLVFIPILWGVMSLYTRIYFRKKGG